MAFMISKEQPSYPEVKKVSLSDHREEDTEAMDRVTSQLYLKSSSAHRISESLEKDVVLRRIRHHKTMNKVRKTFEALLGGSPPSAQADALLALEQKWLEHGDAFSSP